MATSRRARCLPFSALAIVLVAGAALRTVQTRDSLWVDELHTAWCALGSLDAVSERAAIGNQSPLFFWLEWLLVQLLGASEFSLRLPSLVAGSLIPLALFALARRWTQSDLLALLAAALTAFDPLSIFFASEARPYAVLQLAAAVHVALFAELVLRPSFWLRLAFVAGAGLLFHLHYTAALVLAAEVAFWGLFLWAFPAQVPYRWPALLADCALTGLVWLPAASQIAAIFSRRENWSLFVPQRPWWEIFQLLAWSFAALILLPLAARQAVSLRTNSHNGPAERRSLVIRLLALCWLLVPLSVAWLLTALDVARLFFPRYLAASAPAALLAATICAGLAPAGTARLAAAAAIMAVSLSTGGIAEHLYREGRPVADRREDWRTAVMWLNAQLPTHPRPILLAGGLIEADGLRQPHDRLLDDYCLSPITSLYPVAADRGDLIPLPYTNPGILDAAARELVGRQGGAWLIVRGTGAPVVIQQTVASLTQGSAATARAGAKPQTGFWKVAAIQQFGSIHIARIEQQALPRG